MLELIAELILLTSGESTHFDYHVGFCKMEMWLCVDIVYHMVLKDRVIKKSFDFLGGIPSG